MREASLLIVTAIVEVGAGACFLLRPGAVFEFLLGVSQVARETTLVGRVAGAALVALGVASWLGRNDQRSLAERGLLIGLLFYNCAVAVLLVYAALGMSMVGVALWPGVVLHTLLASWCGVCICLKPGAESVRR